MGHSTCGEFDPVQVLVPACHQFQHMRPCSERDLFGDRRIVVVGPGVWNRHLGDRRTIHLEAHLRARLRARDPERDIVEGRALHIHRVLEPLASPHVADHRTVLTIIVLNVDIIVPVLSAGVARGGIVVPDPFTAGVIVLGLDHARNDPVAIRLGDRHRQQSAGGCCR